MNYHYMITELGLDTIDKYKAYTYKVMSENAKVKVPRNPTTSDTTYGNGMSFGAMDTWLNTDTNETWILMYITDNGNFWWRYSRMFEKIADRCYKDILQDYAEYVIKFGPER